MTPRQKDALQWLEQVGEANEFAVHRAGYQHRTLEALRTKGRVHGELVQGRCRPYWVYSTHEHRQVMAEYAAHEEAVA